MEKDKFSHYNEETEPDETVQGQFIEPVTFFGVTWFFVQHVIGAVIGFFTWEILKKWKRRSENKKSEHYHCKKNEEN